MMKQKPYNQDKTTEQGCRSDLKDRLKAYEQKIREFSTTKPAS